MSAHQQPYHYLKLHSPLGDDLVPYSVSIDEALSDLFTIEVGFLANQALPAPEQAIGQPMAVSLSLGEGGEKKFFHGRIQTLAPGGAPFHNGQGRYYSARLVPVFWSATQRTHCRIFQDKTTEEIVTAVLKEHGATVKTALKTAKPHRYEYCVQYQETDWQFVSRLLAHEGWGFFFEHSESDHALVLFDHAKAHPSALEAAVPYRTALRGQPHVRTWQVGAGTTVEEVTETGYDFTRPTEAVSETAKAQVPGDAFGPRAVYDYRGEEASLQQRNRHTDARSRALALNGRYYRGVSDCRSWGAGHVFRFTEHEEKETAHQAFVISRVRIDASLPVNTDTGDATAHYSFTNRFECLPAEAVFVPQRQPKPVIPNLQTARVTTARGEQLYDEYGRVRVRFHWDNSGSEDAASSCLLRVVQPWAGAGWGTQFLPRQGQEVVVQFIGGDPDQPIVTGAVYNGDHPPPYDPVNSPQVSGIKTRSTENGTADNFNELRFDDRKGEEKLVLQAERDHELKVKQDQTDRIGRHRDTQVAGKDTTHVKEGYTLIVDVDVLIESGKSLTLRNGPNSITLDGSGIAIKGQQVTVNGGSLIGVTAPTIKIN